MRLVHILYLYKGVISSIGRMLSLVRLVVSIRATWMGEGLLPSSVYRWMHQVHTTKSTLLILHVYNYTEIRVYC